MAKQCKYAKKYHYGGGLGGSGYCCTCSSPNANERNKNHHQGAPIMGYTGDDWYNICINGKSRNGTTPSKCKFYG
jgi:hypothetical protein